MERPIERRTALALLGLPLVLSLGSSLAGCGVGGNPDDVPPLLAASDLTAGVGDSASARGAQAPIGDTLTDQAATLAAYDFAARLLQGCYKAEPGGNVLVSPLSALFALALAENGAAGETLSQMEAATGMGVRDLTSYLEAYARRIGGEPLYDTQGTGEALALRSANSVWLRDSGGLSVTDDYLATCKDDLFAQVFSAPFDETTRRDINSWVSSKTDGMIEGMVDEISDEARLFLINALAFDGAWSDPYKDDDVRDDTFTAVDGTGQDVRMMRSHESHYLENGFAEGFVRPYENHDFARGASGSGTSWAHSTAGPCTSWSPGPSRTSRSARVSPSSPPATVPSSTSSCTRWGCWTPSNPASQTSRPWDRCRMATSPSAASSRRPSST